MVPCVRVVVMVMVSGVCPISVISVSIRACCLSSALIRRSWPLVVRSASRGLVESGRSRSSMVQGDSVFMGRPSVRLEMTMKTSLGRAGGGGGRGRSELLGAGPWFLVVLTKKGRGRSLTSPVLYHCA